MSKEKFYAGELAHFGILGMKWGIRRYQNEDGTLTDTGKRRYSDGKGGIDQLKVEKDKSDYEKSHKSYETVMKIGKALKDYAKYAGMPLADKRVEKAREKALEKYNNSLRGKIENIFSDPQMKKRNEDRYLKQEGEWHKKTTGRNPYEKRPNI